MGGLFSGDSLFQDDLRPMLRVRVIKLVQASQSDDKNQELDAYVQLTFGQLEPQKTKKSHRKLESANDNNDNNDDNDDDDNEKNIDDGDNDRFGGDDTKEDLPNVHGRETLNKGNFSTETKKTNVKETKDQARYFDETFYFPISSIKTKSSLEISLWDKDIGPQITDDYFGKSIIYYNNYNLEDEILNNPLKKARYLLPNKFDESKFYSIKLTDQTGSYTTGILDIEVEFQNKKHFHYNNNINDMKRDNTRHDRYEKPQSNTCSIFSF